MKTAFSILAMTLVASLRPDDDWLEPSVRNEVDHALSRAPADAPAVATLPPFPAASPFCTNGLSRTAVALRLISAQKADGRWYAVWNGATNDLTSVAVERLRGCCE